jgi:preprotein translocase subunit SecG
MNIFNYIALVCMPIMTLLILVQTRGATVGAGLGGSAEVNTTRRGSEKTIFQLTIITATIFALSILLGIIK